MKKSLDGVRFSYLPLSNSGNVVSLLRQTNPSFVDSKPFFVNLPITVDVVLKCEISTGGKSCTVASIWMS